MYRQMINGRDETKLTRSWLIMSNDSFFLVYGFNWVPPLRLQDKVKKELSQEYNKNNLADFLGRKL